MVNNNPKEDQHEILLKKGSGDIQRNGEVAQLSSWEKVTFHNDSKTMEKATEIGPPAPISPGNMMPVFANPGESTKEVEFCWTPISNAAGYRLRISGNPYFSSLLLDRKVDTASVVVTGMPLGAYYWSIQSYDGTGRGIGGKRKEPVHDHCQEQGEGGIAARYRSVCPAWARDRSAGKTEVGARVMVNGREVPTGRG